MRPARVSRACCAMRRRKPVVPCRAAWRLSPASHGRAIYASRPKDPTVPRHGKAGNLNHALRHVLYPEGVPPANALVVVFDCDMEAHGDFLAHTLPYMATQPRTALVQTPQTFYNVVQSADIFNHHNLTFYQAMQPGLDAWGATVCCGTNFVARASALYEWAISRSNRSPKTTCSRSSSLRQAGRSASMLRQYARARRPKI